MRSRISQGYREDFYELTDQRFLGADEFVDDIRRDLKEKPTFVYDISFQELIDSVSVALSIPKDLFYSKNRNRPGAFGRAVVGYLGKELADLPFKSTAEHFNRDPVVISRGIKGLEKRIREDETFAAAIATLRASLTKNRVPILI